MNGQFDQWVQEAQEEVRDKGLAASQQAIMLVGFGAVMKKLDDRVIKLNGKVVGTLLVTFGGATGAAIAKALELV